MLGLKLNHVSKRGHTYRDISAYNYEDIYQSTETFITVHIISVEYALLPFVFCQEILVYKK